MSTSWTIFVVVLTLLNIAGLLWLLFSNARSRPGKPSADNTTGHVWDEDLAELNNPLPRWWLWLFILTVVFSLAYLVLYPGLGNFAGHLGWTSTQAADHELAETNARLESLYARFRDRPLEELAHDPAATKVGRNVFANNCAACHGSDARGAKGYPNLVDDDWLYGGEPDTALASVLGGRRGVMPPLAAALPGNGVDEVAHYVRALSGQTHDAVLAAAGQPKFETICAACHGVDGKGNHALGAPNLSDDVWLYGGELATIRETIEQGRSGVMPAWEPVIGRDRARLAVAWLLAQRAQDSLPVTPSSPAPQEAEPATAAGADATP